MSVHATNRRGLTLWHTKDTSMMDLACTILLDRGSSLLVAGNQDKLIKVNVATGHVIQEIETQSRYAMMKYCRYICAATIEGSVDFLDPETLVIHKQWRAQTSRFSAIDAKSDFLVTCGWTQRSYGTMAPDPIAKVYDLKKMEQVPPISFPAGAAFVQIHPRMSTTCVVGSRSGQIQVVDIMNPNSSFVRFTATQLEDFVMSPSGNAWVLVDQQNILHVWGAVQKLNFNEHPQDTEFADEIPPMPSYDLDQDMYVCLPV